MAAMRQRPLALLRSFFPTDWRMRRRYRLPTNELNQPYYIYYPSGLVPDTPWPEIRFDENGVAVTVGGYNPVTIAQFALYSHERALRGVPGSRETFLAQARYLQAAQEASGSYPYATAYSEYGVEPGFISAMAQGTAASALVRAYALTEDERYRQAAYAAVQPLKRDVSKGGASYVRDRCVFFEEVASAQPCHILNGHLFAAFALYDLDRFELLDADLAQLHRDAVATLVRWIDEFDANGWSYYQLAVRDRNTRHLAHISYHQLHVAQLHVYAAMTGETAFADVAARWQRALDDVAIRARVWLDSASWLAEVLSERAGFSKRGPWRPIENLPAACAGVPRPGVISAR